MKKLLILGFLVSLGAVKVLGQERGASFSFKEEKFNFGSVKEENGPISHVFEFINTGGSPLIIHNVQASCGCTTPDWSKNPVPPGGKGFVKATFNPSGRPGSFTKTITIMSNAVDRPTYIISFTGTVIPKPLTADQQFPFSIGSLRFRTSHLGFETLYTGMAGTDSVQFINPGKTSIKIGFVQVPGFLSARAVPAIIKPMQKGHIIVSYNATKRNDWDFLVDYLHLSLNGKQDPNYKLTVTANIEEDFSKLTPAQLVNAPKIVFDNNSYNFGTVKAGKKVEFTFRYKNEGKSDLILRKIQNSCSCTTIEPLEKAVKPGGYGTLKVSYDTHAQSGSQNKAINLTTNDPDHRRMLLYIRGTVM